MSVLHRSQPCQPWSKGKLVGQKAPLKLKDIWAIRVRLQLRRRVRDLALFNLAIDSKLRACDLVRLRVSDMSHGGQMASRAMVTQQKTRRPVQFEITAMTREAVQTWIQKADLNPSDFLFTSSGRCLTSLSDEAVRQDRPAMGRGRRVGDRILWGTHDTQDEGVTDPSSNPQPQGCPASPRPYEAGEHSAVPRD